MDPQMRPSPLPDNQKPTEGSSGPPSAPLASPAQPPVPSSVVTPTSWPSAASTDHTVSASAPTPTPAPAASAPAAASTPAPSMPASAIGGGASAPRAKKKGLLMVLVVTLFVLILAGGAAAAYFGYVVPNKPQNVLNAALVNSFSQTKVKSEHFDGKVSVKDTASNQTIAATFTGGADTNGALEVKATVDAIVTKVTLDVRSLDGETYYLKVGGLDGLPELLRAYGDSEAAAYAPFINMFNEQWIEINQSILNQLGSNTTTLKMSQADRDKLAKAYTEHQFLTVQEKLQDEAINGMASYHYKVVVDKLQLKDFVKAVKDAKLDSLKLTQEQVDSFNDALNDVDFKKYPVDVWISKQDKLLDQVSFTFSDNESTISVRFTTVDFNKPVVVTKPQGAKSLLEIISEMLTATKSDQKLLQELQSGGISL